MKKKTKDGIATVGLVIFLILLYVGIGIWAAQNNLVEAQQSVKEGEAHYKAALDLCSQKIEGIWVIYQSYLDHESRTFKEVIEARASFYKAASSDDPTKTVSAASGFYFKVNSVAEAYPQLVSSPVARDAMDGLQSSVNETKMALDNWIYQTQQYNSMRQKIPTSIVGNMFGFPYEYSYYQGERTRLNVSEIIGNGAVKV